MKHFLLVAIMIFLIFSSACEPGKLFGPTLTLNPTLTLTPTYTSTPSPTFTLTPTITETPTPTATQIPEISQDLDHLENLPFKPFEYLTSTEFAQWVLDKDKAGKFPEFPSTAKPITSMNFDYLNPDNSLFLLRYGMDGIFSYKRIDRESYVDYKKRPSMVAGGWQTEYKGERVYFFLTEWLNNDGSHGFLAYIFQPDDPSKAADELTFFLPEQQTRETTGMYFSDRRGCEGYFNYFGNHPNSPYCDWYFANPNIVLPKSILAHWQQTGILIDTTNINGENIPLIPVFPITTAPMSGLD